MTKNKIIKGNINGKITYASTQNSDYYNNKKTIKRNGKVENNKSKTKNIYNDDEKSNLSKNLLENENVKSEKGSKYEKELLTNENKFKSNITDLSSNRKEENIISHNILNEKTKLLVENNNFKEKNNDNLNENNNNLIDDIIYQKKESLNELIKENENKKIQNQKIKIIEDSFINDNTFKFKTNCTKENSLYFIKQFNNEIFSEENFSTGDDYYKIIQLNNNNKISIAISLLKLKERNWIRESIEISRIIKEKREDLDNYLFNKLLWKIIKQYKDFDYLVESLSTYYYYSIYKKEAKLFPNNFLSKTKLPSLTDKDWLNGFEWKGLFIRLQSYNKSKKLFQEMNALNYLFFDYIQIFDNFKINYNNLISNDIIFPIMGYSEICGMILFVTPIVYLNNVNNLNLNNEIFNLSYNSELKNGLQDNKNDFDNFKYDDIQYSCLLYKINPNNVLEINNEKYGNDVKYMIINAVEFIPSLFQVFSINKLNFLYSNVPGKKKFFSYVQNSQSEKTPQTIFKKVFNSNLNKEKIRIEERNYDGINFKIFFNKDDNYEKVKNHNFISLILNNEIYQNEKLSKENKIKTIPIPNSYIIQYQLSNEIKLKYSIIQSVKTSENNYISNLFFLKSNFFQHFENWCKMISKNSYNIYTYNGLRDNMKKFGINFALVIFSIINIQNENIVDILKIGILTKIIKLFFNNEENTNLILKINNYEVYQNGNIFDENNFECLNKENICLANIRKEKIYYLIKSILYPNEILPQSKEYFSFIYEQLLFNLSIKYLKWKLIDEYLYTQFFSDENKENYEKFSPKLFLIDLIFTARKKPFLFLSTLEEKLNFTINPFIKFKSSISLESLYTQLKIEDISINETKNYSYIKPDEISGYILAKCIHISNSLNNDFFNNELSMNISKFENEENINNIIPKPNTMETKIKMKENNNVNILENSLNKNSIYSLNSNVNNITNIKQDYSEKNEDKLYKYKLKNKLYWKNIANDFSILLPSICYKQKFKFNDLTKAKKKTLYKYLDNKYTILKYEAIRDWNQNILDIFNKISSVDFSIERAILKSIFYCFINSFYFENNISKAKKFLTEIKEICSNGNYQLSFQELGIINLFEGLLQESYFLSEQFFSISTMMTLLSFGEPRGRNNDCHGFMMFPLWKVARKTNFFEDSFINENFKEMFHALEYNEYCKNSKKFVKEYKITFNFNDNIKKNVDKILLFNNINLHDRRTSLNSYLNENIDERSSYEKYIFKNEKNNQLSESNFQYEITEINTVKNFIFPPISKKTESLNSFFNSKDFIIYFLKQIQTFFNYNPKIYDQDFINDISNDIFAPNLIIETENNEKNFNLSNRQAINNNNMNFEKFSNNSLATDVKQQKKAKLSHFIYDELLNKLSYKKNIPNGILISFGNNPHFETSHDNYDYLSLPRIIFKLKNKSIKHIYSGWEHNIVIDSNNEIFSWGNNQSCQCGISNNEKRIIQTPINLSEKNNNIKVKKVSCGNEHNLILTIENELYGFGSNDDGILCLEDPKIKTEKLIKIPIPKNEKIIEISSGTVHNLILTSNGKIYSWGSSQGGQLGLSEDLLKENYIKNKITYINKPKEIITLNSKIKKISCGEAHSLALTDNGLVYSWGFCSSGQLGLGFCEDSFEPGTGMNNCRIFEPRLINSLPEIKEIKAGGTYSMFISENKEIYACGVNDLGQLGISDYPSQKHVFDKDNLKCFDFVNPTLIECFFTMKVDKISCGEGHCLAIVRDSTSMFQNVWSWGTNKFGQLGLGNLIKSSLPKPINYLVEYNDKKFEEVSCGGFHSLCLVTYKKGVKWIDEDFCKFIVQEINQSTVW